MAENLSDSNAEQEGGNLGEEAIWKTDPNEPGVPVRILKRVTRQSGKTYVQLENVDNLVPANQVYPIAENHEDEDSVMWHKPGEDPIKVKEVAIGEDEDAGRIMIQTESGFEWVPAEQIRRLGEEAVEQVIDEVEDVDTSTNKEKENKPELKLKVGDKIVKTDDEEMAFEIIKIEGQGRKEQLVLRSKSPNGAIRELTVRARDIEQEIEEGTSKLIPAESIANRDTEVAKKEAVVEDASESGHNAEKSPVDIHEGLEVIQRDGGRKFIVEGFSTKPHGKNKGEKVVNLVTYKPDGNKDGGVTLSIKDLQDKLSTPGSPWRLAESESSKDESEASHLTAEELKAQKAIVDYLTPRIKILKDRVDSPDPGDDLQLAKLEALMQKVQEGKFTESTQYSGVNKIGKNERGSHSALSYFARVREFSDEGSAQHNNADSLLAVLREAGIDIDHVDDLLAQEDAANGGDPHQNNGNNQRRRSPDRPDSSSGNKKDRTKNKESIDKNSTWLDPRRIQELKIQYQEALGAYGGNITEAAKKNLKTILIEREISRAIGVAERVKKLHGVGEVPEVPNDAVKEKMAEMLELSMQEISEMATEKDDLVLEQASAFKKGQDVKIIKHDGSVEDGWKVKGYSYSPNAKPMVRITKGRDMRMIDAETLKQYQETADPDAEKANLEALKSYFGKDVKVKVDDRIIEGKFGGISLNGGAYVDIDTGPLLDSRGEPRLDEDGNPRRAYDKILIAKEDVNDFLNWQNEKLTSEVEEEEKAKRIAEMKAKIAPYLGKEVRVEDEAGNPIPGYKCVEYLEDQEMVKISSAEGGEHFISAESFLEWQETAEIEKWDKVPPFKKGMKVKLWEPSPDGSGGAEKEWTVEDAVEEDGAMHIILSEGSRKAKIPYGELKQVHDNGGRPVEPPVVPPERPPLPEMMSREKEYLTWYERIKKQYNKLDKYNKTGDDYKFYEKGGNYYKFMVGFLGVVAMSNLVGLTAGAAIGIQHKRHYARIKAKQEKEIRMKEKEKRVREKQQLAQLPKEHVAG